MVARVSRVLCSWRGALWALTGMIAAAGAGPTSAALPASRPQVQQIDRPTTLPAITLRLEADTARPLLAAIGENINLSLRVRPEELLDRPLAQRLSVNWRKESFWKVMLETCQQTGLRGTWDESVGLVLSERGESIFERALCIRPPALITARVYHIRPEGDPAPIKPVAERFFCKLTFFFEPHVRVVNLLEPQEEVSAVDERKRPMLDANQKVRVYASGHHSAWTVDIPLQLRADGGKRLAVLRGSMRCVMQTRSARVALREFNEDLPLTIDGYRVVLSAPQERGDYFDVPVTAYRDEKDLAGFDRLRAALDRLAHEMRVEDAAGKPLARAGGGANWTRDRVNMKVSFRFFDSNHQRPIAGPPALLRWEAPVQTKEIEIPFEFADLALP